VVEHRLFKPENLMNKYFAVLIILLGMLHSCKPKENLVYLSNNNFAQEVSQARYAGLQIREGDRLQIMVSALDELAVQPFNRVTMSRTANAGTGTQSATVVQPSEYIVSAEGTIDFPVLGSVYCRGMTKKQLQAELENRLLRYLTDPLVSITLANFNFSVLGEVKSPGQKTSATERLNLFQAIALAGDMTYDANRTSVKLIRYDEATGRDEVFPLDLSEASIVNSPFYYLQQNDILYVEPDRNRQVAENRNSRADQWIKYGGFGLGILTLIISLTR